MMLSTGLAHQVMKSGGTSLYDTLYGLVELKVYDGTPPATADAAPTGTLLCTVVANSAGSFNLHFDDDVAGVLSKAAAQTWSGTNGASGTCSYGRFVKTGDGGALSTTDQRAQVTMSNAANADIFVSNPVLVNGQTLPIAAMSFTLAPNLNV